MAISRRGLLAWNCFRLARDSATTITHALLFAETAPGPTIESLQRRRQGPLSPLPQLLPRLDEYLHFSRAGKSVVDQAAILEAVFVELPYAARAQVREVVTKLLKLFFVQNIRFFGIGSPGHNERS
jgi:hypothetical protein